MKNICYENLDERWTKGQIYGKMGRSKGGVKHEAGERVSDGREL